MLLGLALYRIRKRKEGEMKGREGSDDGKGAESYREEHARCYEEGPFAFKCSTSCHELDRAGEKLERMSDNNKTERKEKGPARGFRFPYRLAICAGGYLLRLVNKHGVRLVKGGHPEEDAGTECPPLVGGAAPLEESAENAPAEESSATITLGHFVEPGRDSTKATCFTVQQIEQILAKERKNREDVLEFTMEQSALRSKEKEDLRDAIRSRDREIEQNSEVVDRLLTSISECLGISFSDLTGGTKLDSCSKQSTSESTTSPDSTLTPKFLIKESTPDIWRMKHEMIIEKIMEMAQVLEQKTGQCSAAPALGPQTQSGASYPKRKEYSNDGNFSSFLKSFRVEQFEFFTEMKDKESQLQEYSKFVSKWHKDISEMKERQAKHYQCELDSLVEQQQQMCEEHEEQVSRLIEDHAEEVHEIRAHHQAQLAEKEGEIQLLTREFERQSDRLQQEMFRMEDKVQNTVNVAMEMERDINLVWNKNRVQRAKHKAEKKELEARLKDAMEVNEKLAARLGDLQNERTKNQAELSYFLQELSTLSTSDRLPSFDSRDSYALVGRSKEGLWSGTSSLDVSAIKRSLFQEDSVEIPSLELLQKVSVSDRYEDSQ